MGPCRIIASWPAAATSASSRRSAAPIPPFVCVADPLTGASDRRGEPAAALVVRPVDVVERRRTVDAVDLQSQPTQIGTNRQRQSATRRRRRLTPIVSQLSRRRSTIQRDHVATAKQASFQKETYVRVVCRRRGRDMADVVEQGETVAEAAGRPELGPIGPARSARACPPLPFIIVLTVVAGVASGAGSAHLVDPYDGRLSWRSATDAPSCVRVDSMQAPSTSSSGAAAASAAASGRHTASAFVAHVDYRSTAPVDDEVGGVVHPPRLSPILR